MDHPGPLAHSALRLRADGVVVGVPAPGDSHPQPRGGRLPVRDLIAQPQNMSPAYLSRVAAGVLMLGHAYAQAQRVRRL